MWKTETTVWLYWRPVCSRLQDKYSHTLLEYLPHSCYIDQSSERLSDLPKVAQLISAKARMQSQINQLLTPPWASVSLSPGSELLAQAGQEGVRVTKGLFPETVPVLAWHPRKLLSSGPPGRGVSLGAVRPHFIACTLISVLCQQEIRMPLKPSFNPYGEN